MAVAKEKEKERRENVVVRTFRDTRSELRKVVWPSREEAIRLTAVVLAVSLVTGLLLFGADAVFTALYSWLLTLAS